MRIDCKSPRLLHRLLSKPLEFNPLDGLEQNIDVNEEQLKAIKDLFQLYEEERIEINNNIEEIKSDFKKLKLNDIYSGKFKSNFIELKKGSVSHGYIQNIIYQVDRIITHFKIDATTKEISINNNCKKLILFYRFNEIVYSILLGLCDVNVRDNVFEIVLKNNESREVIKRKFFSNFWEKLSRQMIYANVDSVYSDTNSNLPYDEIKKRAYDLRDREFHIPSYLSDYSKNSTPDCSHLDKICFITVFVVYFNTKKKSPVKYSLLNRFGISKSDLSLISKANDLLDKSTKYLKFTKSRVEQIKPDIHVRSLWLAMLEVLPKNKKDSFNNSRSEYFEKEYIKYYFENKNSIHKNKYKFHNIEIKKENLDIPKDVSSKYSNLKFDIDVVIEDLERKKYIFIQCKCISRGGDFFNEGDMKLVTGKLSDGVYQINGAKKAFENGFMDRYLKDVGIEIDDNNDAIFCLIHNISNFDFQLLRSGVVSYDWNTFRNLLQGTKHTGGNSKQMPSAIQLNIYLPLEDPDYIRDWLCANSPVFNTPESYNHVESKLIYETLNCDINMNILNKSIITKGIGI
jgi:hypothetical protein